MSIPLRFMTAVIRKDAIATHYPGGLTLFQTMFNPAIEDECLYALCSMSGGELGEVVEKLGSTGFDTDRHVAIGDMWAGPFHAVPGIAFEVVPSDSAMPQWLARGIDPREV